MPLDQPEPAKDRMSHEIQVPVELKCSGCSHKWLYKGKREYRTTCPNCGNTVRVHRKTATETSEATSQVAR